MKPVPPNTVIVPAMTYFPQHSPEIARAMHYRRPTSRVQRVSECYPIDRFCTNQHLKLRVEIIIYFHVQGFRRPTETSRAFRILKTSKNLPRRLERSRKGSSN